MTMENALISAVRKRPCLYDKNDNNYSNKTYVRNQWKEIGREIGFPADSARKKWTHLRDYFQRNNRLLERSAQQGGEHLKIKKWYHYDDMAFLRPHVKAKTLFSNLADEDYDSLDDEIMTKDIDGIVLKTENYIEPKASPLVEAEGPTPDDSFAGSFETYHHQSDQELPSEPTTKAIKATSWKNRPQKRLFSNVNVPSTSLQNHPLEYSTYIGHDEDEQYFLSLVPKMKMLDPVSKLECQLEIHGTILKYIKQAKTNESADG